MREKVLTLFLANLVGFSASLPILAQGIAYQLEPGSLFTPAEGLPVSLSGTFEWAGPVIVFDPIYGQNILEFDTTALSFRANGLTFRLNASPLNDCVTTIVPSPTGPQYVFCEVVDTFDGTGALLDPGLYIAGQGQGDSAHLVFPSLGLYRNYGSPDPELLGQMQFSAVSVPEPGACLLVAVGLAALYARRRL